MGEGGLRREVLKGGGGGPRHLNNINPRSRANKLDSRFASRPEWNLGHMEDGYQKYRIIN